MKELTNEENAKVYTELINRLEDVKDAIKKQNYGIAMEILCKPYTPFQVITHSELKESEDERIRKDIVFYIAANHKDDGEKARWLYWLENHDEQKTNVVVRRFLIGDTFIDKYYPTNVFTVTEYIENGIAYVDQSGERFTKYYDDSWDDYQLIEQKPKEHAKGEDYGIDGLYNAIRILEKTLGKVDGYQTDDGILEHECAISAVKKLYEQKPAWSEEDEKMLKSAIGAIGAADYYSYDEKQEIESWLKSIKDRAQPQPKQEWSEEDEAMWAEISDLLWEGYKQSGSKFSWNDIINWFIPKLKFLRLQTTWKPSDEQMVALDIDTMEVWTIQNKERLLALYQDLKKLKGE